MADTQTNYVQLIWKSVDETSVILNAMGKNVGAFGDSLASITGPAANLTTGLLKVEAGALTLAAALGGFAVNEAGKFDASMRELSTLTGEGEVGAKRFGVAIAEMGQHSLVPLEDLTGAMYKAVSQTGSLEAAQKLVTVSEKLAVAGRADLTDTTLLLAGSLEAYGKNMDSAAHFSDVLFSVVQGGQTNLTELTQGLGGLAPTAKNLGVSFDELGAAVAVITKNSIPTSEALTGLKAILSNILNPTKDASEIAAALGINFSVAGLQSKGFAKFMVEVAEKTHGSATQIGALFGSMEAFNSVMSLASEGGSKFTAMLKNIEHSTGATQQAYDLMSKSFSAGNQVIINNLKLVAIAFGSQLLEPVRHVQEAITNFFIKIQDAAKAGAFDAFFATAQVNIQMFAEALEAMIANLPAAFAKVDFGPLLDEIDNLIEGFRDIGGNIDLTSVDGLAKALQLVVDGVTRFIAVNRGLLEALPKVFETLSSIGKVLLSIDPAWFALGGTILASLTVLDKAGGAFTLLKGTLEGLGSVLSVEKAGAKALPSMLAVLNTSVLEIGKSAPLATAGLTGLALAAGYLVGGVLNDAINQATEMNTGFHSVGEALFFLTHDAIPPAIMAVHDHAEAVGAWSLDIDKSIASLGGFNGVLKDHTVNLGIATGKLGEAGVVAGSLEERTMQLALAFNTSGKSAVNAAEFAKAGFTAVTEVVVDAVTGAETFKSTWTNVGTAVETAAETMETALEKSFKATQAARDKAEEFRLEWAKLESQERQLVFEVAGKIAVAQIEADSAKVVAAFESISESVKSTGETINGLVESFAGIQSGKVFDKSFIESIIKEEMALRKQSFELQRRLVETQIAYLTASTERLKSGDALITVKGDGLKPHLTAIMFELLAEIQISANGQGQSFLMGLPLS